MCKSSELFLSELTIKNPKHTYCSLVFWPIFLNVAVAVTHRAPQVSPSHVSFYPTRLIGNRPCSKRTMLYLWGKHLGHHDPVKWNENESESSVPCSPSCPIFRASFLKNTVKHDIITTSMFSKILYLVHRASRYNSLLMTNLMPFFISLLFTPLNIFRASQCSSSRDRIVLIHQMVWLVCVISHSHRLIILDDVLIQFDLLMMSTVMLETCWEV
jgi:hypothetical protein